MLQRNLLGLIILSLIVAISYDLYRGGKLKLDTFHKMEYLSLIHPRHELTRLSDAIKENASHKKSLSIYQDRLMAIESGEYNYTDSILWPKLIDDYDLHFFKKEIRKIPSANQLSNAKFTSLRNKFIYTTFINYLLEKVSSTDIGDYFSKHYVIKDLANNLSLTNNYSRKEVEIVSINNRSDYRVSKDGEIRIPLSDTLSFEFQTYNKRSSYLLSYSDTVVQHYFLEIGALSDGLFY